MTQSDREPEGADSVLDPSVWRGMTSPRLSRRQLLTAAGAGAGAIGLSGLLAACGVKGVAAPAASTSPNGVGSASWWA